MRSAAALYGQIDPDLRWSTSSSSPPAAGSGSSSRILTAEDAELAIAHGAAGVVVSNHGGRQARHGAVGRDALPPMVSDTVAGRIDVLVDGGIRRAPISSRHWRSAPTP